MYNKKFLESLQKEMNEKLKGEFGNILGEIYCEYCDIDENIINSLIKNTCDTFLKNIQEELA